MDTTLTCIRDGDKQFNRMTEMTAKLVQWVSNIYHMTKINIIITKGTLHTILTRQYCRDKRSCYDPQSESLLLNREPTTECPKDNQRNNQCAGVITRPGAWCNRGIMDQWKGASSMSLLCYRQFIATLRMTSFLLGTTFACGTSRSNLVSSVWNRSVDPAYAVLAQPIPIVVTLGNAARIEIIADAQQDRFGDVIWTDV